MLRKAPVPAAPELELDLARGIAEAEHRLDELRPRSVRFVYGEHVIGTLPERDGAERLRGIHLRETIVRHFAREYLRAAARAGAIPNGLPALPAEILNESATRDTDSTACSTCRGGLMTGRMRSAALCTIWVTWTAVVITHYFTLPANRFLVFEGPIGFPQFWREAAVRSALAIAAAAAIALAAWTVGQRLSKWFLNGLFTEWIEALVFQLALGFMSLSYALFALACLGLYRRAVLGSVVMLLAAAGCLSAPRSLMRSVKSFPVPRRADAVFVLCAGAAVACGLIAALAPETEYDALCTTCTYQLDGWRRAGLSTSSRSTFRCTRSHGRCCTARPWRSAAPSPRRRFTSSASRSSP